MGLLLAAGWGAFGAAALLVGAWVALRFHPKERSVGLVMGFGAGALIAAVAYELVPAGGVQRGTFAAFGAGAVVFFVVDRLVTQRHRYPVSPALRASRHDQAAQAGQAGKQSGQAGQLDEESSSRAIVLGALLDGVPESVVLGMSLAAGSSVSVAFLTAVFMSNLPEALGASAGLQRAGHRPVAVYRLWASIVVVAAIFAAAGYWLLESTPSADGSAIGAFAAGAVLTMLANSMMPKAFVDGGKVTGLLTVLGFAVAGGLSMLE